MAEESPTVVTADGLYVATIDPRPVDVIKEGRRPDLAALADRIEAANQRASVGSKACDSVGSLGE